MALATVAVLRYAPPSARRARGLGARPSVEREARAMRVSGLTERQAARALGARYTEAALRADVADGLLVERAERRAAPTEAGEEAAAAAERAARSRAWRPLSSCAPRSPRRRHPLSSLPACRPTQRCAHRGVGRGWHCVDAAARSATARRGARDERAADAAGALSDYLCAAMALP